MPYEIRYSNNAHDHLRALTARQRAIVVDGVEDQLVHQPTTPTRNRKRVEDNPLGPWVLRLGTPRVYYRADEEPEARVTILSVAPKDRNFPTIDGQVFDLTRLSGNENDTH